MEAQQIYKTNYHVDYRDADFFKRLKLSSLFTYLQESASLHAANLGIGIDTLQEKFGVAWVVIRMRVDIERMPLWNEEVYVETWPIQPKKLELERDFIVRDMQGNIVARAMSSWVVMDVKERQIRRSEIIGGDYPPFVEERAIEGRIAKLKSSGNCELCYKKHIGYSDIDINGHLNNSKYIDYLTDCFPIEEHGKCIIKSIQINYVNEAMPGDVITFYRDISDMNNGIVYVEGINDVGGAVYFKAQVTIEPINLD